MDPLDTIGSNAPYRDLFVNRYTFLVSGVLAFFAAVLLFYI